MIVFIIIYILIGILIGFSYIAETFSDSEETSLRSMLIAIIIIVIWPYIIIEKFIDQII